MIWLWYDCLLFVYWLFYDFDYVYIIYILCMIWYFRIISVLFPYPSLVQIWSRKTFHSTLRHLSASPSRQASSITICDMALIFSYILLYVSIHFQYYFNTFQIFPILFQYYCEYIVNLLWYNCVLNVFSYYFENILKCFVFLIFF